MRGIEGFVIMAIGVGLVSGCAGQRSAQTLNRLQSDVTLLDQRVGQLERASVTPSSATAWPTDSQASSSSSKELAAPSAVSSANPSSATASIKPTTKEIQQALKNAGVYQGKVDGRFGPRTREAIRAFQRTSGLKVDGLVGKQTWAKLSPYLTQSASASSGELSAAETLK